MDKKEAAWRLRRHTLFIIAAVILAAVLTFIIYSIKESRPDDSALTVGLEDTVIITVSDQRLERLFAQGAGTDNVKIIKPSLQSVVLPVPQSDKYALFEELLISQSCDLMISTAGTARELYRLGLIYPAEGIDFTWKDSILSGCLELGYIDLTDQGDYLYPSADNTVCAYVLKNSNNREEAVRALRYLQARFEKDE